MTPEQIEEELETLASYYGNDFNGNETKEHKALTAALEYIEDMREIEAAAVEVMFSNGRRVSRNPWYLWALGTNAVDYDSLREAFKAVKGGKD